MRTCHREFGPVDDAARHNSSTTPNDAAAFADLPLPVWRRTGQGGRAPQGARWSSQSLLGRRRCEPQECGCGQSLSASVRPCVSRGNHQECVHFGHRFKRGFRKKKADCLCTSCCARLLEGPNTVTKRRSREIGDPFCRRRSDLDVAAWPGEGPTGIRKGSPLPSLLRVRLDPRGKVGTTQVQEPHFFLT